MLESRCDKGRNVTLDCATTTTSIGNGEELLQAFVVGATGCVATSGGATSSAKSSGSASGVPNKPMVPTATDQLDCRATGSLRRHIGQPFGSGGDGQRQRSSNTHLTIWWQMSGQRQRATSGE